VSGLSAGARGAQQAGSGEDEDAAYFDSLSAFVGKVRGEPFPREAAHNMTFKDVARNVEVRDSAPTGPAMWVLVGVANGFADGVADGALPRSAEKGVGWGCAQCGRRCRASLVGRPRLRWPVRRAGMRGHRWCQGRGGACPAAAHTRGSRAGSALRRGRPAAVRGAAAALPPAPAAGPARRAPLRLWH